MTAPLLTIKDLKTWFPIRRGILSRTVGHVRAVDGVSLTIAPGESLGLVGESGCGKTTLARTVARLDRAHSGSVLFEGADILTLGERALRPVRRELQMIFQDPYASLNPRMTVLALVTEAMVQHGEIKARDREEAAVSLLADVGLGADCLHRYPHEFSGGQRQRISVARALSLRPRLVLCDEAVSALDVSVQAQVVNLLRDLQQQYGLAYLFISHDLSIVRHICSRIAVMYLGRIVEEGPARQVVGAPVHPYTRALVSAIPRVRAERRQRIVLEGDVPSAANPPAGCRFHPRCPFAIPECARTDPELEPATGGKHAGRIAACIRKDEI